ncbi:MAG: hypothetical protein WA989_05270 [Henriciella sp.]|uniref:hypothetical protein n=1 Tax=Henriciella sp. TaxID=1968823 RepID=UPI003C780B04
MSVEALPPPAGKSRYQHIVDEATRRTVDEMKITLPQTARRAAEITVDLMIAEVLTILSEGAS